MLGGRTLIRRRSMRPGTMFVSEPLYIGRLVRPDVYVVIDDKTEIGFFTGGKTKIGDVAPSVRFEVIA